MNVMPLFHIHGLIAAVAASLSVGASIWCTGGFNAMTFFASECRKTNLVYSRANHIRQFCPVQAAMKKQLRQIHCDFYARLLQVCQPK